MFLGSPAALSTRAIISSSSLIQGAWVHQSPDGKRVAIELWWYREPTPEEETESARLAAAAFLGAHGTRREDYEVLRVLRGREKPAKGRLPRLVP